MSIDPQSAPRNPSPARFINRLARVAAVLILSCVTACVGTNPKKPTEEKPVQTVWPGPPDEPRFVYETTLRSVADIRRETEDERFRRTLTGEKSVPTDPVYKKPAAIVARKGRIYVADPPIKAIVVFDVPRQRVFRMGTREPNQVKRPIAMAIDAKDRVYVLDGTLRRVLVFDALGLFEFAVGDPKQLKQPAGLAVSPDGQKIFVVDRGSLEDDDHRVIAYSPDGKELFRIGPRGAAPGQFNIPIAATVSPDGTLLILDSGNFRVQGFDLEGKHRLSFGGVGIGLGQFSRPRSITTDPEGNIYVADASFNNIQIFSPKGELLMWIGNPSLRDGPGQFGLVAGITVDETGRLYVTDNYHSKIEVYRRAQETRKAASTN